MQNLLAQPWVQTLQWPVLLWMFLLILRAGYVVLRWWRYPAVRQPGVPRWPRLRSRGKRYLLSLVRHLTPWRFLPVRKVTDLGVGLAGFAILALLISFLPMPEVRRHFPWPVQAGLAGYIIAITVLHTYLQRLLASLLTGKTTDVYFLQRFVIVFEFIAGLIPFLRRYEIDPALGLSAVLEAHEQAEEEKALKPKQPLLGDTWHVVVRNGNLSIRIATIYGKQEAQRVLGGVAALVELREKDRGIHKRRIIDAAWNFGMSGPRAE